METEFEKRSASGGLKAGFIVCIVLVVILAISSLVLFMRVNILQWQLNEAQFNFYYVFPAEPKFGVYDLEDELNKLEWIDPYQEDVFDCSEMSAYLEWNLENKGWNTVIILGDSPFGSGGHAWLLVETSEGKYMPVETTTLEVVWWNDPNFDKYWEYDYKFEDIREAFDYSEKEFDWWA